VSGAAAASIKRKFIGLFPPPAVPNEKHFPSPSEVAAADIAYLRTGGLSQRKAEYIQGLAEKFATGELSAPMLVEASDEELLEKLIAVRGLGRWSVEMFACFALKRTDIFSTGDLGVQRGMAAYIGKDVSKLKAKGGGKWKYMSEQDMLSIANQFVPYRYGPSTCRLRHDADWELGVCSCGTCGELRMSIWLQLKAVEGKYKVVWSVMVSISNKNIYNSKSDISIARSRSFQILMAGDIHTNINKNQLLAS
jgi:hypothetical protein